MTNKAGIALPYFCKYICPQGILEGGIPLSIVDKNIRATLGTLFNWKFTILITITTLSIFVYRPFCKWICPLGAFYALFNKIAIFNYNVDKNKCVSCGKCAKVCKMDGECITACPTQAISTYLALKKKSEAKNSKVANKNLQKA